VEQEESVAGAAGRGETAGLDAAESLATFTREDVPPVDQSPSAQDHAPPGPDGLPPPARPWASICPYLLDASGSWRAAKPSREHRCTAVTPPEPLRPERQRRLCLGPGHLDCPAFLAAREIRAQTLGEVATVPPGRAFARTAPVILQRPPAVAVAVSTLRTSLPQLGLLLLMLLAILALVLARFVAP
jgi:hypothetical protein